MSLTEADLVSGMFNFRPSRGSSGGGSGNSHRNGSGHGSDSGGGHSAPMISGTAAAVLALQSTFQPGPAPSPAAAPETT